MANSSSPTPLTDMAKSVSKDSWRDAVTVIRSKLSTSSSITGASAKAVPQY